MFALFL
jgi:hypothetical protein